LEKHLNMGRIVRNIEVPTGNICVMEGDRGFIEFLSIGDYGKGQNIKADFLGLTKEINGVPNGEIMPLSEKWVITVSTQYGCSMGCKFCDVPLVGKGLNASYADITHQVLEAIKLHPEIKYTKRLNVHFARMGEPTFNEDVLWAAHLLRANIGFEGLGCDTIHPVVSTMMPKHNKYLREFLSKWIIVKNEEYKGEAGLQLSINSTSNSQREEMFSGSSLSLEEISEIGKTFPLPMGRKYALNFALADDYEVDPRILSRLFDVNKFMVKITPLHVTKSSVDNDIKTTGGYDSFVPYKETESQLKDVGFDVIVFVPSYDEDLGMITCGNAILSGKNPQIKYRELI
jgi:23S rRNA (adenine2503-C2)-methyltransferase